MRYCETTGSCPYANAYWNGSEMRFGNGFAAADDVVGHELTHAVTEAESNLIYWGESGAINEALSDIFGEFIDLSNSGGTDTAGVRWLIGEDAPGGAIRSMSDPPLYGDPDRRFSALWYTGAEDNRGVHFNSGVANKLAFLLTDGGSFNGQTVTALGLTQVARLFYEAQVNLLVPGSDYYDLDAALVQAAEEPRLVGRGPGQPAARRGPRWRSPSRQTPPPSSRTGSRGASRAAGRWSTRATSAGPRPAPPGDGPPVASRRGPQRLLRRGRTLRPAPGPKYRPNMDTWMVYGPFSLSQAQAAWAEFDLYLDVEYPFDEVFWGVSVDGVTFDGYAFRRARTA